MRLSGEVGLELAHCAIAVFNDEEKLTTALDELDKGRAGAAAIELTVRGAYVLATTEALKRESAGHRQPRISPQQHC